MSAVDLELRTWRQIAAGAWLLAVVALFVRQVVGAYVALLGG